MAPRPCHPNSLRAALCAAGQVPSESPAKVQIADTRERVMQHLPVHPIEARQIRMTFALIAGCKHAQIELYLPRVHATEISAPKYERPFPVRYLNRCGSDLAHRERELLRDPCSTPDSMQRDELCLVVARDRAIRDYLSANPVKEPHQEWQAYETETRHDNNIMLASTKDQQYAAGQIEYPEPNKEDYQSMSRPRTVTQMYD